jgi:hypothetical protein
MGPLMIRDLWLVRLFSEIFLGWLLVAFTLVMGMPIMLFRVNVHASQGWRVTLLRHWCACSDSKKVEQRTSRWYTCVRNSFLKVHNFTFKIL